MSGGIGSIIGSGAGCGVGGSGRVSGGGVVTGGVGVGKGIEWIGSMALQCRPGWPRCLNSAIRMPWRTVVGMRVAKHRLGESPPDQEQIA